ncbi:MAG: hypothetical protein LBD97_11045 [Bifidobacteriaceae bacterium]|jgi:hypothetical protein|nr:hypothetical protein [Bifidobacteriaceae bacterium]
MDGTALIVAESCFGNTDAVAEVVAEALASAGALAVDSRRAHEAPSTLPAGTELLVLAAPTHNYSLPRWRTRRHAEKRGAKPAHPIGVREWMGGLTVAPKLRVVCIDTALHSEFTPSSAAKAATRLLRRAGFANASRGPTFFVEDAAGPLRDSELARAKAWAIALAASLSAARGAEAGR